MSHCQIFYPFDNKDGYISVVCHRDRFLDDLLSVGWCKTAAEAVAMRDAITQKKVVTVVAPNGPSASDDTESLEGYKVSGPADADGTAPVNKKRDKLSLKK